MSSVPGHARLPAPGASYARVTRADHHPLSWPPACLPSSHAVATALPRAALRAASRQQQRSSAAGTDTELYMSVRWQGMSGCAQVLTASIAARTASPCGKTGVRATALASSRASQADRSCPPSAALAADPASASTRRARGNRMWGQRFCNRPHGVAMSSPERRVWPATASASSPRMSANSPTAAWLLSKWHAALPMPRRLTGRAIGARRRPQRLRAVSDGSAAVPEGNDSLSDEGDFEVIQCAEHMVLTVWLACDMRIHSMVVLSTHAAHRLMDVSRNVTS